MVPGGILWQISLWLPELFQSLMSHTNLIVNIVVKSLMSGDEQSQSWTRD